MKKSQKQTWLIVTILASVAGVFTYIKNPNLRAWKDTTGTLVNMATFPMTWSYLSNKITINSGPAKGSAGTWSGNTITWSDGSKWTY